MYEEHQRTLGKFELGGQRCKPAHQRQENTQSRTYGMTRLHT